MLSRVANSIYWMSRYLERSDNIARFMDVNASLILDMGWERKNAQWKPLLETTGDQKIFNIYYSECNEKNVVNFLTFDRRNPNSIINCIEKARENARIIRETISTEMWKTINILYHLLEAHEKKRKIEDLQELFNQIHHYNYLFVGLIENTMIQDEAWHFSRMGRLIERAEKTTRMLDVKYFFILPQTNYPTNIIEWGALLKSLSGYEMYCKQFHHISHKNISEFLILNQNFPRAIAYCIQQIHESITHLIDPLEADLPVVKEMNKINRLIEVLDIKFILDTNLHNFLDLLLSKINILDNAIFKSFFDSHYRYNLEN